MILLNSSGEISLSNVFESMKSSLVRMADGKVGREASTRDYSSCLKDCKMARQSQIPNDVTCNIRM